MSELATWKKRAERWRDTDLTVAEYAREIGCDARIMAAAVSGRLTVRMLRRLESVPPPKPRGPRGGLARRREAAALSDAEWMGRHSAFERQHVGARRLTQRQLLKRTLARIHATREQAGRLASREADVVCVERAEAAE